MLKLGYQSVINELDKEEVLQFVFKLIIIPSHEGIETQEREIAHFLSDWLEREEISVDLQEVEGERFNLIGIIPGKGSGKSLMLNAHMDTVPLGSVRDPSLGRYGMVGGPMGSDIAIAHKGIGWIEIEVKGKSPHGSGPEVGINAVTKAAQLLEAIEKDLKSKVSKCCDKLVGEPTLNIGVINGAQPPI